MTSPSREEQNLHAQAAEVRERLDGLAADLRVVDDELEGLAPQRAHHRAFYCVASNLLRFARAV